MKKTVKGIMFLVVFYLYYTIIMNAESKWDAAGLIVFCALLVITVRIFRKSEQAKIITNASLDKMDEMTQREFTTYAMQFYKIAGYGIELIDKMTILQDAFILKKGKERTFVQCKHSDENIERQTIQSLNEGMKAHHCQNAIFITNAHYTLEAKALGEKNLSILIDREELEQQFKLLRAKEVVLNM